MNKKIILVGGDPNSINSEIIFKSWKKIPKNIKKKIILISNYNMLLDQFKRLNYKVNLMKIDNYYDFPNTSKLKVLNINLNYKNPFKVSKKSSSIFILKSLDLAHKLGLKKDVAGIINCPINKNLLNKSKIGVTEYFATKCAVNDNSEVMLIKNKKLMVSPLTTHLDIKSIPRKLTQKLIIKKIKVIDIWYKKEFNKKAKIAILGLNPHNAELRKNSEEKKIIIPAIKKLKNVNIKIDGPYVSDTIFINDYKKFDIIVGMYHDQVLAPFKALFKFDAINLTLGLKYIRVSPDHGVAIKKIMKKNSSFLSLLNCIKFINK